MGDRCWVELWVSPSRAEEAARVVGWEVDPAQPGTWIIEECNYGAYEEREKLATAGIPYAGCSGAGGGYGPMLWCLGSDGEDWSLPATPDFDPYVELRDDGTVIPGRLSRARRFLCQYALMVNQTRQSTRASASARHLVGVVAEDRLDTDLADDELERLARELEDTEGFYDDHLGPMLDFVEGHLDRLLKESGS